MTRQSPLLKGSALLLTLLAIGLLLRFTPLGQLADKSFVDTWVKDRGLQGIALFLLAGMLGTSVGLPRQIVAWMGGYAFGAATGTGLATCAALAGCTCTFTWARLFGGDIVRRRLSGRVRRVDAFLSRNTFKMALLIRFLPAGSNFLTNLTAGVASVRPLPFFLGSGLGYIPQSLVFALLGSGLKVGRTPQLIASIVLFVLAGLLGVHLVRLYRKDVEALEVEDASP